MRRKNVDLRAVRNDGEKKGGPIYGTAEPFPGLRTAFQDVVSRARALYGPGGAFHGLVAGRTTSQPRRDASGTRQKGRLRLATTSPKRGGGG